MDNTSPQPPTNPIMPPASNQSTTQLDAFSSNSKLPEFSPSDPSLWFIQVNAQFAAERISAQTTKFHRTVSQLPTTVLQLISDLIENPGDQPFDKLVERISSLFGTSKQARIVTLLNSSIIGEQRPSHALHRMKYLAGDSTPMDIIRTIWIRQLPIQVQHALTASTNQDINFLSQLADQLMELDQPAIATTSSTSEMSELREQVTKLSATLANMNRPQYNSRPPNRWRSPTRRQNNRSQFKSPRRNSRSNSPRRRSQRSPTPRRNICFYHEKFGSNAQKCQSPCTFQKN